MARTDDKAMLKAAADLTRDLNVAKPSIYWADLIASALLGYAGLFTSIFAGSAVVAIAAGIVAVLALYRAGSFIHELTHVKPNAVPGFRLFWNLTVGIPLLVPSFMGGRETQEAIPQRHPIAPRVLVSETRLAPP